MLESEEIFDRGDSRVEKDQEAMDAALCAAYRRIQKLEDALKQIFTCADPYGDIAATVKEVLGNAVECTCVDFDGERMIDSDCPIHGYQSTGRQSEPNT
jgi:hypothetical protein